MLSIIVAFPRIEDANKIKAMLVRQGYEVLATCSTGAQVVNRVNTLDSGIVLCGYRFADMQYNELRDYLPRGFEMLLVASPAKLENCVNQNIVCLGMPIKVNDLTNTIDMMTYNYRRRKKKEKEKKPRQRTEEEKAVILNAKQLLMERNNLSEEEAHRYIQKVSMDSGTNMVETAYMIISTM